MLNKDLPPICENCDVLGIFQPDNRRFKINGRKC